MNYSKTLLRVSALFALIGVFIGSHMAGAGSYAFRPVHAHILVVGWLSLFAWAVFYKVFYQQHSLLASIQVWSAIIGSIGLTAGMWLHMVGPFPLPELFTLLFYIIGGSILLISFVLFLILTFTYKEQ
ncbi:hypothetical protein [Alteribacillus iranensis]|uniref:Cytochrome C and Quinol oxidase polypeptide I n=1 Tax=Alteribacillus iranensis TaxID=930128 RepID=A0A1I2CYM9_9BACI|nr:hypothetical protein [Alteribacillus iranensis]SFE73376.1 hypothetical protein SAMN05192532_103288 [Alteribacillus iranensis]